MCGIAGFLQLGSARAGLESAARSMGRALNHRGPDDQGIWVDESHGIALAHARLSILDLSPAGHQPMVSHSGRYVIVFNGEIYNHGELRRLLEEAGVSPPWRGHSDTETLLAGFDSWGIRRTVEGAVGMFAFAVWDRDSRTLTLGRDRLGEKPLYYGWQNRSFLFGSELKALRAHEAFRADIDRSALTLLLRYACIPAPHSIFNGIGKLIPGTLLTVSADKPAPILERYWTIQDMVLRASRAQPFASPKDAVDELEVQLKRAVAGQMLADVPLGAFLSGGVDSSAIVALMQAQASRPVRTFSIGFHEAGYNEAEHAKAVARYLGTDHTELYVTAKETLGVIPRLPSIYCEPFGDSSQIPTFLVAQMARQHVTVALSGDAGDELFCGYNRYAVANTVWRYLSIFPAWLRRAIARVVIGMPPQMWNTLLRPVLALAPRSRRLANPGDMLHKSAGVLPSRSLQALYHALLTHWEAPERIVLGGAQPPTILTDPAQYPQTRSEVELMMALDMLFYLPDDILTKVDRAAMAVSLETRVPFLDHRVVEFAWRLPLSLKVRDGKSKWALRQVLYRYVPAQLIERPKAGFQVPIGTWLRGPLREWAEDLLNETRLRREGFFDPTLLRNAWSEHLSGKRNWHYRLWNVLMFQAWLEAQ